MRNERGQILVFTAVSLVALLGVAALSIDASYMYDQRNKLYAAADAAAKSAAFAYWRDTASNLDAFAQRAATDTGFTDVGSCGSSGTRVCVNHPYAGNNNMVEAIVSQPSKPTFFGRVLGWDSASPGARAVAGLGNPANCITFNGDVEIGNFAFKLEGCGLDIGGNLTGDNPNSRIVDANDDWTTVPVNVTGDCFNNCGKMGDLHTQTPPPVDTLAAKLTAPSNPGGCGPGLTPTLTPGCYDNISAAVTTLQPGHYYITGTVNIDNLSGSNVFLYMTGLAKFNITGQNKRLQLTAPTDSADAYQGMVIWQNVTDTQPFACPSCPGGSEPNNFLLDFNGTIYMPGVDQTFGNGLTVVPETCSLFIAHSLTVRSGNGTFSNLGCANLYNRAAFLSVRIIE
jgi:hypothetical protein